MEINAQPHEVGFIHFTFMLERNGGKTTFYRLYVNFTLKK
jgi:hypothetical protein